MKSVNAEIRVDSLDCFDMIVTGSTLVVGGAVVKTYFEPKIFEQTFGVSARSLDRFRAKVIKNVALEGRADYMLRINGKFWYTRKTLELRSYKKHLNAPRFVEQSRKIVNGNETLRSGVLNWMDRPWDYAGTVTYANEISMDQCAIRMEMLNRQLIQRYAGALIEIFYVTEANPNRDGHHTHFAVSVKQRGAKNKKRTIEGLLTGDLVRGGEILVEPFASEYGNSWLSYITKHLERKPDSYFFLTNVK
ncbi:MAG: hypothetical protein EOO08_13065 [Chitinophagaceae bacterium]|nr:MAG: hypothetical protein EOO08_13065 [Chitinophagaceae bacterium]